MFCCLQWNLVWIFKKFSTIGINADPGTGLPGVLSENMFEQGWEGMA